MFQVSLFVAGKTFCAYLCFVISVLSRRPLNAILVVMATDIFIQRALKNDICYWSLPQCLGTQKDDFTWGFIFDCTWKKIGQPTLDYIWPLHHTKSV